MEFNGYRVLRVWFCACLLSGGYAAAADRFAQLADVFPAPTEARLGSGAPGPGYWQQEANYEIEVELDEERSMIVGSERIEYVNHSPHELSYLWMQLDQQAFGKDSARALSERVTGLRREPEEASELGTEAFRGLLSRQEFEGGYRLKRVADKSGTEFSYQIVNTNMRIDLPEPLRSGESIELWIDWEHRIVGEADAMRTGRKELKGGDYAYQIAQWYPRMCAYYDLEGWQVKSYIGAGEFALEFGTFEVAITAPEDFVVAATGELVNEEEVLSAVERERLEAARTNDEPVFIVTEEEAARKLESPATGKKTWTFKAERVRDFAFAASRGYIWDGYGVELDGRRVLSMSAYPKEAAPIWGRYSTEAVALALKTYSEIVYPYPYPVAWSTWGPVGGMEYPMISFQSSWEIDEEGTYPEKVRNYVISVVVHEIGHIWFPMIINSDERQWMWQDEGLNTFVEYVATSNFDARMRERFEKGVRRTVKTMAEPDDPIIMTASDSQTSRGFQAYTKPALGLSLLRESILGREVFQFAFQEYARRWAFKRPTPYDFFRTMEDASGVDLDWFWRGWFYGNEHVDLAIESVEAFVLDDEHPERSAALRKAEREAYPETPLARRWEGVDYYAAFSERLQDWYYDYDEFATTEKEIEEYQKKLEKMEAWERELLAWDKRLFVVSVRNVGGMVMPVTLDIEFEDGSERRIEAPADIWRFGDEVARIPVVADQAVTRVELDRDNAFADANLENNVFPQPIREGRFKLKPEEKDENPMREALFPDEEEEDEEEKETSEGSEVEE